MRDLFAIKIRTVNIKDVNEFSDYAGPSHSYVAGKILNFSFLINFFYTFHFMFYVLYFNCVFFILFSSDVFVVVYLI